MSGYSPLIETVPWASSASIFTEKSPSQLMILTNLEPFE